MLRCNNNIKFLKKDKLKKKHEKRKIIKKYKKKLKKIKKVVTKKSKTPPWVINKNE